MKWLWSLWMQGRVGSVEIVNVTVRIQVNAPYNIVTVSWQYRDNIVTVRVQVNAPYNIVKLLIGSQRNGLMLPNLQLLTAGLKSGILIEVVGTTYIRCVYIIFGRKITRYTVMYCVYIRFWPNLVVQQQLYRRCTPLVDVISNRTAKALFKLAIA